MILIVASINDPNANMVAEKLHRKGAKFERLNTEEINLRVFFSHDFNCSGSANCKPSLMIEHEGRTRKTPLSTVKSVYFRGFGDLMFNADMADGAANLSIHETKYSYEYLYMSLSNCYWLNNIYAIRNANNKLHQLDIAKKSGLKIPQTIVTQSAKDAQDFFKRNDGRIICKTINTGHYDESCGQIIMTNRVTNNDLQALDRLKWAPTLFQEQISIERELRVTVVGRHIFAAAIENSKNSAWEESSAEVDWRRKARDCAYVPILLPESVRESILKFMSHTGLEYGAIDIILDQEGNYVFLECNPSGQFAWVEAETGYPIYDTIIDVLLEGEYR